MLKIICDENIPLWFVKKLMSLGYNVLYVAENNHGIPDTDVLDMAVKNKAILITRDSDFGELIFFL